MVEDLAIDDDRNLISPGNPVILIVEDDPTFARILLDLAREKGLKALVALRGSSALALAREFRPGAITLDIQLPDMVGWTILDLLKHDPLTRHIPVHIISGDENRRRGLALGAMSFLEKSVTRDSLVDAFSTIEASARPRVRKLMLVSTDTIHRNYLSVVYEDIRIINSGSGGEAMAIAAHEHLDGLVIDAKLPDIPAVDLVREICPWQGAGWRRQWFCMAPALSPQDTTTLSVLSRTSRIRLTQTPERLLDETTLLLHRSEADMSERQRQVLAELRKNDNSLEHRKVLVVDDDLRNIYCPRAPGAAPADGVARRERESGD